MNIRFVRAHIKFAAIVPLDKILIGGVTDARCKLPVVGQKVLVPPAESAAKLTGRLKVLSLVISAKSVFTGISYHIT
ncbi:hypothetical protein ES703_99853 [subsurface metagenome]